ncbi:MAG: sodium ion-translocating decarboxylase subunit beta [Oscillospiraceae bacterium]|nr:sodium ion-translocating decarboxylase subunit beta [Oscillospiraceae bacterium]
MMTEAQKKMKRYMSSIERKLNLPRDVKKRVMTDLMTSVAARREAGLTDEEIYGELGSAEKAAADLNEQMKEFACRGNPWRFVFLAIALLALLRMLCGVLITHMLTGMTQNEAASIGIIGGADGPTAVFVTSSPGGNTWFWLLVMIAGIAGFLLLRRRDCKAAK